MPSSRFKERRLERCHDLPGKDWKAGDAPGLEACAAPGQIVTLSAMLVVEVHTGSSTRFTP